MVYQLPMPLLATTNNYTASCASLQQPNNKVADAIEAGVGTLRIVFAFKRLCLHCPVSNRRAVLRKLGFACHLSGGCSSLDGEQQEISTWNTTT